MILGDIIVLRPHITYVTPPAVTESAASGGGGVSGSPQPRSPAVQVAEPRRETTRFEPRFDLVAHLRVVGAGIDVLESPGAAPLTSIELETDLVCSGLHEPIQVNLTAKDALGETDVPGSTLTLTGHVNLLSDGYLDPAGIAASFELEAKDFDLRALSPLSAYIPEMPRMSGSLNSALTVEISGSDRIETSGFVQVASLAVSAPALGAETLFMENVRLDLDLGCEGTDINISKLNLSSPILSVQVEGALTTEANAGFPVGQITLDGVIDLPELTRQIPATLGLREDLSISNGLLKLSGSVAAGAGGLSCAGVVDLADVGGRTGEKDFRFGAPIHAEAGCTLRGEVVRLDFLSISSSFADIEGSGTATAAVMRASIDLAGLSGELGQILDLGELQLGGSFKSVTRMKPSDPGQYRIETDFDIDALGLAGLAAFLKNDAVPDADMVLGGLVEVTLSGADVKSLNVHLGVSDLRMRGGLFKNDPPVLESIQVDMDVGLDGDQVELRGLKLKSAIAELSAQAKFDSAGGQREGAMDVRLSIDQPVAMAFMHKAGLVDLPVPLDGSLSLVAGCHMSGQTLNFERLDLSSDVLALKGKGSLARLDTDKMLDFQGDLKLDYEKVAQLCEALSGYRPKVSGTTEQAFRMKASLADPDWIAIVRSMDAAGGLTLPSYEAFGIVVKDLDAKLTVADSRAVVLMKTEVNEGVLHVAPFLDVSADHAIVGVPDDSEIMKGVKLTDKLASELLGLIHPAFRGCTVLGGDLGMTMDRCRVPVDKARHSTAIIEGELQLNNVLLSPGGMLKDVVNLLQVKHAKIEVSDQAIRFECRDGRIHPSPLEMNIDGNKLTITGSVGLDKTVDYVAAVPVTEKLVGRDVYPYLKGESLELRIGGTINEPELGRDAFLRAIRDLVKKAGKKAVVSEGLKLLEGFLGQ